MRRRFSVSGRRASVLADEKQLMEARIAAEMASLGTGSISMPSTPRAGRSPTMGALGEELGEEALQRSDEIIGARQYRVLGPMVIWEGFEKSTETAAGSVEIGDVIDILETRPNAEGQLRLRFELGWVTLTARLEDAADASGFSLQRAGQEAEERGAVQEPEPADPEDEAAAVEMPEEMEVECPAGCGPGDLIVVATAAGQEFEVAVPDGIGAGELFIVELPAAPIPAAAEGSSEGEGEKEEPVEDPGESDESDEWRAEQKALGLLSSSDEEEETAAPSADEQQQPGEATGGPRPAATTTDPRQLDVGEWLATVGMAALEGVLR